MSVNVDGDEPTLNFGSRGWVAGYVWLGRKDPHSGITLHEGNQVDVIGKIGILQEESAEIFQYGGASSPSPGKTEAVWVGGIEPTVGFLVE